MHQKTGDYAAGKDKQDFVFQGPLPPFFHREGTITSKRSLPVLKPKSLRLREEKLWSLLKEGNHTDRRSEKEPRSGSNLSEGLPKTGSHRFKLTARQI